VATPAGKWDKRSVRKTGLLTPAQPDCRLRWAAWVIDLSNHDPAAG